MNPIIRNIIAVLAGIVIGSIINMTLVELGNILVPVEGGDLSNMEDLKRIMPTFTYKNFIFPFLAHALGTLFGAFIAAYIAATHKTKFAFAIGGFFLTGGIAVNMMLPGPIWFEALDLLLAYIPMAFIGGKIALNYSKKS
ncbi:hypothetical protein [uncultured Nonlabens sp.]|uniref:hypothetical protein n=1 Tax=uncultured Nonlabens sp. TaxID=859306 RepID=UPI0030D93E72|tara:strand:+ start:5490 stop:5909 length:420 start_codon:yes stop_codon:yes gene_type:complete